MKGSGLIIGLALVGGLGAIMAITNPSQATYEEFASEQLVKYLQENACTQVPTILGTSLQSQCADLVLSSQPELKQLVAKGTVRQNLILFSLYKTDLAVNKLLPFLPANVLPTYHVETVGAVQTFHIYKTEQK